MFIKKPAFLIALLLMSRITEAQIIKESSKLDYSLGLFIGIKSGLTEGNSAVHFIEDISSNSPRSLSCWQAGAFLGLGQVFVKPFRCALGIEYSFFYVQQNSWASHQIPELARTKVTNLDTAWQQSLDFYWRLDNFCSFLKTVQGQFSVGLALAKHTKLRSKIELQLLNPVSSVDEIVTRCRPNCLKLGFHLGTRLIVHILAFNLDYFFLPFLLSDTKEAVSFLPLTQHSFSLSFSLTLNKPFLNKI